MHTCSACAKHFDVITWKVCLAGQCQLCWCCGAVYETQHNDCTHHIRVDKYVDTVKPCAFQPVYWYRVFPGMFAHALVVARVTRSPGEYLGASSPLPFNLVLYLLTVYMAPVFHLRSNIFTMYYIFVFMRRHASARKTECMCVYMRVTTR